MKLWEKCRAKHGYNGLLSVKKPQGRRSPVSALLKQGTPGLREDPIPQALPGGAVKEQCLDQPFPSRGLGLESLPQEWLCLAQPPQKGLGLFSFPKKRVSWKLLCSKWAECWRQRSSQEFFPFPEKTGKQLQLQDGNSETL